MSTAVHVYLEYEQMLKSFRCQDLANLLASAGQSKNGKKSELYERCIAILKKGNVNVQTKIRDLYNQLQGQRSAAYGPGFVPGLNSNSNSSTSNSPDPNMINGSSCGINSSAGSQRYQPSSSMMGGMQLPGTSFNPSMMAASHNGGAGSAQNGLLRGGQSASSGQSLRVQFERLAFFNLISELMAPIRMIPNPPGQRVFAFNFNFTMSSEQATAIASHRDFIGGKYEYIKQIHLRFGLYENSVQADNLPPNLLVNVNGKPAALPTPKPTSKPNADIVRPGRTIEITPICKLAPNVLNRVEINWSVPEPGKSYCVGVYMFDKVSVATLVKNLQTHGVKEAELTRNMIRQKLSIGDDDFEIETNTYKVSLLCPLMKFRMQIPCRSVKCQHAQCFNLESYLQMNEKKPTWNCPVCDQNAAYDTLMIDSLFVELLDQCRDCDEVEFAADGTWSRADGKEVKKASAPVSKTAAEPVQMEEDWVDLDESLMISGAPAPPPPVAKAPPQPVVASTSQPAAAVAPAKEMECIDLTLDSDEEETAAPAAKRPPPAPARVLAQPIKQQHSSSSSSCRSPVRASENETTPVMPPSPCASIISLDSSSGSQDTSPDSPSPSKASRAAHVDAAVNASSSSSKGRNYLDTAGGMASSVGPSSNQSSVAGARDYASEDSRSVGAPTSTYAPLSVLTVGSVTSNEATCHNTDDNSSSSKASSSSAESTVQNGGASPEGIMVTPPPIESNPASVNAPVPSSSTAAEAVGSSSTYYPSNLSTNTHQYHHHHHQNHHHLNNNNNNHQHYNTNQLLSSNAILARNLSMAYQPPQQHHAAQTADDFDNRYVLNNLLSSYGNAATSLLTAAFQKTHAPTTDSPSLLEQFSSAYRSNNNFADDSDILMNSFDSTSYQQQQLRPSNKPNSGPVRSDLHSLVNDPHSKVSNSKLPHRKPPLSKEMMLKCAEEVGLAVGRPGSPNALAKRPMTHSPNYHVRHDSQTGSRMITPPSALLQNNPAAGGAMASVSKKPQPTVTTHHHAAYHHSHSPEADFHLNAQLAAAASGASRLPKDPRALQRPPQHQPQQPQPTSTSTFFHNTKSMSGQQSAQSYSHSPPTTSMQQRPSNISPGSGLHQQNKQPSNNYQHHQPVPKPVQMYQQQQQQQQQHHHHQGYRPGGQSAHNQQPAAMQQHQHRPYQQQQQQMQPRPHHNLNPYGSKF